jgi:hypothetical protein
MKTFVPRQPAGPLDGLMAADELGLGRCVNAARALMCDVFFCGKRKCLGRCLDMYIYVDRESGRVQPGLSTRPENKVEGSRVCVAYN